MKLIAIIIAALSSPAYADDTVWHCNGILTSNGSCVGSSSNQTPPIVDCGYDSSDPRCYRSRDRNR